MSLDDIVIEDLTPGERLRLIDRLWDSLGDADVELSAAQLAELDARLATADEDAKRGKTWDQIKHSLTVR